MGELLRFPAADARQPVAEQPGWAELHMHTAFSFLQGCAQPDELVAEAVRLGISVLAVTDRDGLYAARRLTEAAKQAGIGTAFGAELSLGEPDLGTPVVLARSLGGFRRLSAVISEAQLAGGKGAPRYDLTALAEAAAGGQWAVLPGCPAPGSDRQDVTAVARQLERLTEVFGSGVHAELVNHHLPEDSVAADAMVVAARRIGVPVVASGAVHCAAPRQARLAQAVAALRRRETLDRAAGHLMPAPTAHLRSRAEMARWLARYPGVLEATLELGGSLVVDLDELRPELPGFPTPDGYTEDSWLRYLVERACAARYGDRGDPVAGRAWQQVDHELSVIAQLRMAGYFLIVHDICQFAIGRNIWCQGRGSAASSLVCYVLRITSVDVLRHEGLLFERFLSMERGSPPDIDIDFEAGRREEVIQYVYEHYGRRHAAQVANVITYQPRLAVQDAARCLGYPAARIREMTRHLHHEPPGPEADVPGDVRELAAQLHTLPRHLGVHSGGMVLTRDPIGEFMPVEWATAEGRSVLGGDKDDVAAAGMIKIDLLGLGILSALHTAADLIHEHYGVRLDLASIPQDDPDVYRMIASGQTLAVFQAESRAQVSTLPLLQPRDFNDLAIAASIIRPGPIQAGSKNPLLRRRRGEEPVTYPHPLARRALQTTLGVCLWQEQAMMLAVDCGGLSAGEADRLRKAMAAKHAVEKVAQLRGRLMDGMARKGIPQPAAERITKMIEAFSDYGFPQSHAQSMAHLIYASAWIKLRFPAALLAATLAHQPMGFYDSQSLIQEAKRLGIAVRGLDIHASDVHSVLEPDPDSAGQRAIRRGLTSVTGLSAETARTIVAARAERPFDSLEDVARRTQLPARLLERLAAAGGFDMFGEHRRSALWTAGVFPRGVQPYLPGLGALTPAPDLPEMTPAEQTAADLATTGASADVHPVQHVRSRLTGLGAVTTASVRGMADQERVRLGGLAKYLQRPPTARGVAFGVLEDEAGMANLVISPPVWERCRRILIDAPAILLDGHVERAYDVVNVVVHDVQSLAVPAPAARRRRR